MAEKKTIKKSDDDKSPSTTNPAAFNGEQYAAGLPDRKYDPETSSFVYKSE